ncbi:4'-phosphopantetheinyl transferase [Metschnikowia bicuspidata var. bicuspidata NRRL YB-4993]|uniref:4'-phosphopantetheinyl transferase n=1 Tax=Metschnikowia bicuspidata var. bicuspidata NRRL YB-4993 TaxID=869754 RepID=A0A1A0HAG9_9ASCO|nr:4'-phosphopantetheinyl transferase [Metschnikowia bicuspidata var. bicuspidata NRRL YB-4993]OBA20872.1 4'-phosphopantetheinyl transferase [Metschnikowia bicuspidata var. bicuspidata NRRL YB-4993]
MIKAIGVDLVKVLRISRILQGPRRARFLQRVLHDAELTALRKMQSPQKALQYVAGSWAAKEAVFKTLDEREQRQFVFREWRRHHEAGRPGIGRGPSDSGRFLLSISHDGDHLVAMVVRVDPHGATGG